MTKLKNTDEKCKCHCHGKHSPIADACIKNICSHCNPEKQGDWESEFDRKYALLGLFNSEAVSKFTADGTELGTVSIPSTDMSESIKSFIRQVEKQTRESERERIAEQLPRLFLEWRNMIDEQYEEGRRTGETQVLLSFPDWLADQLKQKTKE